MSNESKAVQVVSEEQETSPSLARLGVALAKAQGSMSFAKKDSANPHFKSSYADLASVWAAIREPLSANGLSIIQRLTGSDRTGVVVVTTLLHSSGEYVNDRIWMPVPANATPQQYGSAITYARRYSLSALVGVAADDDDGNAASERAPAPQAQARKAPPAQAKKPAPESAPQGEEPQEEKKPAAKKKTPLEQVQAGVVVMPKSFNGKPLASLSDDELAQAWTQVDAALEQGSIPDAWVNVAAAQIQAFKAESDRRTDNDVAF